MNGQALAWRESSNIFSIQVVGAPKNHTFLAGSCSPWLFYWNTDGTTRTSKAEEAPANKHSLRPVRTKCFGNEFAGRHSWHIIVSSGMNRYGGIFDTSLFFLSDVSTRTKFLFRGEDDDGIYGWFLPLLRNPVAGWMRENEPVSTIRRHICVCVVVTEISLSTTHGAPK